MYDDMPIGDREGEHLHMERGRYDAWALYANVRAIGKLRGR